MPKDPPHVRARLMARVWEDPTPFEVPFVLPVVGQATARFSLDPLAISALPSHQPLATCRVMRGGRTLARGALSLDAGMAWREEGDAPLPRTALDMVAMRLTELVSFVYGHCAVRPDAPQGAAASLV